MGTSPLRRTYRLSRMEGRLIDNESRAAVRVFICENFLVEDRDFGDDDSLLKKELMDSTGILEVISFVEQRFGIKVNDEEIVPSNLDSVNRICAFVSRKLQATLQSSHPAD